MLVAVSALIAVLWSISYVPTNDGPQVILAAHIENHFSDPGSVFPRQLEPATQFAHRGFSLVFAPLEALLGWRNALRATSVLIALTTLGGFTALLAAVEPRRRFLALAGLALPLSWNFYMGFFSFEWGVGLGLWLIAFAARRELSRRECALLAIGLLFQASCHVFTAVLTGPVIAGLLVTRARRGERVRALALATAIGAPAMLLFATTFAGRESLESTAFSEGWHWLALADWAAVLPRIAAPGALWRGVTLLTVVTGSLLLAFVRYRRLSTAERVIAIAAGVFLVAGAVAPLHVPGWQFFSPRFLPLGITLALCLLPLEALSRSRFRRLAEGAIALAAISGVVGTARLQSELYSGCREVLAGLDAPIRRSTIQLPIVLEPHCGAGEDPKQSPVPFSAPARHLGALYAAAHGGTIPYLFVGSSSVHAFKSRADAGMGVAIPPIEHYWPAVDGRAFKHDARARRQILTELGAFGMSYEGVIVLGTRPGDQQLLSELGYESDFENQALFLGRFVPCELEVRAPATTQAATLEWGVAELDEPLASLPLPRAPSGATELSLPIGRIACGTVWVRISSAGRSLCAGTAPDTRIVVKAIRGQRATATCRQP